MDSFDLQIQRFAGVDSRLIAYDWDEAWKYAGDAARYYEQEVTDLRGDAAAKVSAVMGDSVSVAPFWRGDIAQVIALEAGENEGASWLCLVRLHDGRFAYVTAGCDYTGWG